MAETTTARVVRCPHCGRRNRVPPAAKGSPRCGRCGAPLPWVADAEDDNFAEVAEAATVPVLVDLWAEWCGPCRMVSPALDRIAEQLAGRIKLVRVDVDRSPAVSRRFAVQGIPTLLLLNGGRQVARRTGAAGEDTLRAWLEQELGALQ